MRFKLQPHYVQALALEAVTNQAIVEITRFIGEFLLWEPFKSALIKLGFIPFDFLIFFRLLSFIGYLFKFDYYSVLKFYEWAIILKVQLFFGYLFGFILVLAFSLIIAIFSLL